MGFICSVCHERLQYVPGKGYLHANGKAYAEREVACADHFVGRRCGGDDCKRCGGSGRIMVDDHCVQPVPA